MKSIVFGGAASVLCWFDYSSGGASKAISVEAQILRGSPTVGTV